MRESMQPLLEQVPWICSPPLVPDHSVIDLDHLRRMTLGDAALEREVLQMFKTQSADLLARLEAMPADSAALAHTLKGSSRAIGAFDLSDAAQVLEAALKARSGVAAAMGTLASAVNEAHAAIDAVLSDSLS